MYGGAFYLFLKQYGMTQDIFHWEDVRRRLEIGVRKSIRHFSHCSYICCNYTPGNLLVRYNVFDPLISQSISPFFWKETPLKLLHRIFLNNQVPLFFKEFWLFQFRILLFQNKDQSTGIWWKLRWDDFWGGVMPLCWIVLCV